MKLSANCTVSMLFFIPHASACWCSGRWPTSSWWIFIASACLTIAFIHARVLVHRANARSSAALTLIAISVAIVAIEELRIHRAESLEVFASLAWSIQFPIATTILGIVWFMDGYVTGPARAVGWLAAGLRTAGLAIHVLSPT